MHFRKLGIASDHAGKELKQTIGDWLRQAKLDVVDFGVAASSTQSVDYPDYAAKAALAVSRGECDGAILICGSGIGMAITANKFPHVRAASAWNDYSCRMGREHNNTNALCLGARILTPAEALAVVELWLTTPFAAGRHADRLRKITHLEEQAWSAEGRSLTPSCDHEPEEQSEKKSKPTPDKEPRPT